MFKFDKKPEQHIPHLEKNESQQMRGGSQYDAMRQMSSLMGNQAMLSLMQSSGQGQSNETPFTSQIRERFGFPRKPAEQSKAPERTSIGGVSLPHYLREKFEKKSGLPMDDVRVHYNSDQPEQLGALAYTQGTDIYVGPGQEEHLEHELGHVVQQKQGIVQPTDQIKGKLLSTSPELEAAADKVTHRPEKRNAKNFRTIEDVIQRYPGPEPGTNTSHSSQAPTPPPLPKCIEDVKYRLELTPEHIEAAEQYLSSAFRSLQFAASRIHSGLKDRDDLLKPGITLMGQGENIDNGRYKQVLVIVENWDKYKKPQGISELYRGDSTKGLEAICNGNEISKDESLVGKTIEFDRFVSTSKVRGGEHLAQDVTWIFSGEIEKFGRIIGNNNPSESEVTLPPGIQVKVTEDTWPSDDQKKREIKAEIIGWTNKLTFIQNAKNAVQAVQAI